MNTKTAAIGLVLVLSACGDGGSDDTTGTGASSSTGSSSTSSGQGGGGAGGSGPKLETIVTVAGAKPIAGVRVFTSDKDGHLVEESQTDAMGTVKLDVPDGGTATVANELVYPTANIRSLYTYVAIPDGGTVVAMIDDPSADDLKPNIAMTSVTLNLTGIPTGTVSFLVSATCLSDLVFPVGSLVQLTNYTACYASTTYDIVVLARDANGNTLGSALVKDAPFLAGMGITTPLAFNPAAPSQFDMTISGLSSAVTAMPPHVQVGGSRDDQGRGYTVFSRVVYTDPPAANGMASLSTTLPVDGFEEWLVRASQNLTPEQGIYTEQRYKAPVVPSPYSTDLSKIAVPDTIPFDDTDPMHPVQSWNLVGSTLGDALTLTLAFNKDADSINWSVVMPPSATGSFKVPDLPPAITDWIAGGTHTLTDTRVIDRSDTTTYEAYLGATMKHDQANFAFARVKP